MHSVLCAAGYNLSWLMRAIARLGLKVHFALCVLVGMLGWVVNNKGSWPLGWLLDAVN